MLPAALAGSKGSVKIRDAAVVPPAAVLRGMLRVSDSLPRGISRASIARGGMGRLSSLRRPSVAPAASTAAAESSPAKQMVALELAAQPDRQVSAPKLYSAPVALQCVPTWNICQVCNYNWIIGVQLELQWMSHDTTLESSHPTYTLASVMV